LNARAFALPLVLALSGCALFPGQPPRIVDFQPLVIPENADGDGWARPPWHTTLMAIEFRTDRDLWDYAHRHDYHIGVEASLCDGGAIDHKKRLQYDPDIFSKIGSFDGYEAKRPPGNLYRAYFSLKNFPTASDTAATLSYDLGSRPDAVCLQLRGGAMWFGQMFASNVVVVPGTAVAAASKTGPR
jgi:hypothetical protein